MQDSSTSPDLGINVEEAQEMSDNFWARMKSGSWGGGGGGAAAAAAAAAGMEKAQIEEQQMIEAPEALSLVENAEGREEEINLNESPSNLDQKNEQDKITNGGKEDDKASRGGNIKKGSSSDQMMTSLKDTDDTESMQDLAQEYNVEGMKKSSGGGGGGGSGGKRRGEEGGAKRKMKKGGSRTRTLNGGSQSRVSTGESQSRVSTRGSRMEANKRNNSKVSSRRDSERKVKVRIESFQSDSMKRKIQESVKNLGFLHQN